jgi:hypothetical protein
MRKSPSLVAPSETSVADAGTDVLNIVEKIERKHEKERDGHPSAEKKNHHVDSPRTTYTNENSFKRFRGLPQRVGRHWNGDVVFLSVARLRVRQRDVIDQIGLVSKKMARQLFFCFGCRGTQDEKGFLIRLALGCAGWILKMSSLVSIAMVRH